MIKRVCLYREKQQKRYSDKLNLIFVELPKFNKQAAELKNNTETWLFLLKNAFELKTCPPEITGKIFRRFLEIAEVKHLTSTEMETYRRSLKKSFEIQDIANCARKEAEMAKSRQIALRLLQRKMPVEDVISLTDLTKEQVQELLRD